MASTDLISLLIWYSVLLGIGILFFPITSKIFPSFADKGYGFSKIIGVLLTSYVVFILSLSRIIQFHTLTIVIAISVLVVVSVILLTKGSFSQTQKKTGAFFKTHWKLLLFEEILFFIALYFLSYIRTFAPDIHGLEKYMDFGFINSSMRADFFPPKDMWFTPLSINYYYFGHVTTAVLTKLSGLTSNITYNLMLGTIFAMAVTSTFSIIFTFIKTFNSKFTKYAYFFGILAALILTLGGNLHTIYMFFSPYNVENPVPVWELSFQPQEYPNAYWYPNATRFIQNTIHEFPMYSWTVSDLHGHVLDIPFVLLTIGVLFSYYILNTTSFKKGTKQSSQSHTLITMVGEKQKTRFLLFIGLLLSVMYMTNAWDGLIYFLLCFLVFFYIEMKRVYEDHNLTAHPLSQFFTKGKLLFLKKTKPLNVLSALIFPMIAVGVGLIFFSLPFSLSFKPFVSGIGILCSPSFLTEIGKFGPFLFEPDHCQHSPWWQLLTLHGFFYIFVISFIAFLWKEKKVSLTDNFILILIILSTILIIVPEFMYAKDIYPGHYRANTMFKLVFQAFMMLSLSTGYIMFRILTSGKHIIFRGIFLFMSMILLTLIFLYPFQAIYSYYGDLQTYKGLDGTSYLETLYPDDYQAILFLNKNISGQPVILESQGDAYGGSSSYTDYARVSANTGLPTVLGWTVHEWLWRGTYDIPAPRIEEVRLMYESENIDEVINLLSKYSVSYVFVGTLEREKYPSLTTSHFDSIGKVLFRSGDTVIYKLNPNYEKSQASFVPAEKEETE